MKKSLIILLFLISIFFFSQTNNRCENILINTSNISINGEQFFVIIEDSDMLNKMYSDIRIDKKCFEDYLIIECTMQNGNEYYIESLIYEYDKDNYKQKFEYILYSNRQGHQFYGRKGNKSLLSKIKISQDKKEMF